MAGSPVKTAYSLNGGTAVVKIRVQQETIDFTVGATNNGAPATVVNQKGSAKVSGGRRTSGISARKVRVQFTGAVPTGYKPNGVVTIPILTQTFFDTIVPGSTGTYLALPVTVIGVTPEYIN